ncbi:MAG: UDP-N-acetylglucosamine 4,6-dehydratase (inverting) [Vicinamibacterales bacterium]
MPRTYCGSLDTKTVATDCLAGATVLVTGGTGSFGRAFAKTILTYANPARLIVFSRDEVKQADMAQQFGDSRIRFMLGDVRDRDSLRRACQGVDVLIHAAALKFVPLGEYNPFEVVKTNITGATNVIDVALDAGVPRVIALSSDKAANPLNLYGATKLCADKLFIAGNSYAAAGRTRFAIVRYGNVLNSRGSVIPFFLNRRASGVLPITDPEMTRFWITLQQGVTLVLGALGWMQGGEIFVPKIPSMRLVDLARAVAPECRHEIVGIRPGEKRHEIMVPADEAAYTFEYDTHYVIAPAFHEWSSFDYSSSGGRPVPADFSYASNTNDHWLTAEELLALAEVTPPRQAST